MIQYYLYFPLERRSIPAVDLAHALSFIRAIRKKGDKRPIKIRAIALEPAT